MHDAKYQRDSCFISYQSIQKEFKTDQSPRRRARHVWPFWGKATIASTEQPYSDGKSLGRHLQIDDIGHAYLCMHITLLVYKSINVQGSRRRDIPTCEMLKMNQFFCMTMTKNHQTTVFLREKMGPEGVTHSR